MLGLRIPKRELKKLWNMLDSNGSNEIDFLEFADALFPNHRFQPSGDLVADGGTHQSSTQITRQKGCKGIDELKRVSERLSRISLGTERASAGGGGGGSRMSRASTATSRMAAAAEHRHADMLARMERLEALVQHVVAATSVSATSGPASVTTLVAPAPDFARTAPNAVDVRAEVERALQSTNAKLDHVSRQLAQVQQAQGQAGLLNA